MIDQQPFPINTTPSTLPPLPTTGRTVIITTTTVEPCDLTEYLCTGSVVIPPETE